MANQQGNGRKVALPDENRESWRPQDENGTRGRRLMGDTEERERMYRNDRDDNYLRDRERFGSYWDDRSRRWDPDEGYRSTERYGQGQSGYGAGRYEEDRSYTGSYSGRGGSRWDERDEGYGRYGHRGMGDEYGEEGRLHGSPPIGAAQAGWNQQRMYPRERSVGYESPYREPGMQDRESMRQQTRYGSQGYQGWGQQERSWRPQGSQVSHRGKGPAGYMRSDERIREMVCDALTEDHNVDASNVEVSVKNGEVTLSGTVEDRMQKRMAEDCVEQIAGVRDVHNQIRIGDRKVPGKEAESPASPDKRSRA
jgi:osmotically-inducible protein OsmY